MIVEGAIVDADGARAAYVRFRGGRVVEVGLPGTDSRRGREPRIRGIVVPPPVNGHTHLGDAVATREPPHQPLAELVRPPDGYKFRLLATTSRAAKTAAMRSALERMAAEGVAATIDFREEGVGGVHALRSAARGTGVEPVILGRPLRRPLDGGELSRVVHAADGVGLSAACEEPRPLRARVAAACRRAQKPYALHASEERREDPDDYLVPRPDLLVHLTQATDDDLEAVARARVAVAVCPRSNALFGRQPPLATFERLGLTALLGTDNAMFHAPSVWRELEFAYVAARLAGRPVGAGYLARMAFVAPWEWLGRPECARVVPGVPLPPIVLRLPPDDPAYQLVCRGTEHLMVRPGSPATRSAG